MRTTRLRHEFVQSAPTALEPGVLYVSMKYGTVLHLCCCGCGHEVVLPLSPTGWRITYDGETVSLWPSVGNWSFECRSHYWIERSCVRWAPVWSEAQIAAGRRQALVERGISPGGDIRHDEPTGRWARLRRWLRLTR